MSFVLFFKQNNISCVKWCVGNSRLHCLCAHSGPICMTTRENNSYFFLVFFVFFSSSCCLHRCYSWNFHCICVSLDNWFVGEQEQVKDPVNLDSIRSRANFRDYDFQPMEGYNITCLLNIFRSSCRHNRLPESRWQWTRLHSLFRFYISLGGIKELTLETYLCFTTEFVIANDFPHSLQYIT